MLGATYPPRQPPRARSIATALSRSRFVWWVALALLIVNDHVLKGAGLLPGWLTGKLSDFAGLMVAPVVVSTIARARRSAARAACFCLVATLFGATKLWPPAARLAEAAAGALGIASKVWSDPTDLMALLILPVAWRVDTARTSTPSPSASWRARAARPPRNAAAVILGAAACLATSRVDLGAYRTSVYLANATLSPVTARLHRARAPLDCAALASDPAAALIGVPFDPVACWRLDAGKLVPLSRNWLRITGTDAGIAQGPGGPGPDCDAVVVHVDGQPDTLLSWQQVGEIDVDLQSVEPGFTDDLDPHGIYLERLRERIYETGSSLVVSTPTSLVLPEITPCGDAP